MIEEIVKVKEFINKEKCDCGNIATYLYMPGRSDEQNFFCEDCVPRGCSCEWTYASRHAYGPTPLEEDLMPEGVEGKDWKWIERAADEEYEEIKKGEVWVYIDEQGREYPCCEFMWDANGFNKN